MEVLKKRPFNQRKFVSAGLFLTLIMLVVTGILIQIFENFEEGFSIHFFTAIHVLTGIVFAILSVLHTITNWRSLESYIKSKTAATISKEALAAFLLAMAVIFVSFLFAHHHF